MAACCRQPKVSKEIAEIRGVEMGQDCISPARHSAFATPIEMMQFIAEPSLAFRRQADRLQALHRPPLGVPRRGQGDAQDRDHAGLYRGRRQGRRHRRSTSRIHGSPRHAHARRPHLRALGAGRHQLARQDQARRRRQDRLRLRHGQGDRAWRRLVQRGTRVHVRRRLPPVSANATPTAAQPASPRKTDFASAPSSFPTSRCGWRISTAKR